MRKFAKIFETEGYGQILVIKNKDDDGFPQVQFQVYPKGMGICAAAIGFPKTDKGWLDQDACFDSVDEQTAINCVIDIFKFSEGLK